MAKTTLYRVVVKKRQQRYKTYTFPIGTVLFDKDTAIKVAQKMVKSMVPHSGFDEHGHKYGAITCPAASLSSADYYNYKTDISVDKVWVSSVAVYPINIEDNHYEYRTVDIHCFNGQFVISIAMSDIAVLDSFYEALMFIDWFMMH